MSLRRYVNLVISNHYRRFDYSLHRLKSENFFYPPEDAAKARDLPRLRKVPPDLPPYGSGRRKQKQPEPDMKSFQPAPPIFSVQPSACPITDTQLPKLYWFPFSPEARSSSSTARHAPACTTQARHMITAPWLHQPKRNPIVFSAPSSPGPEGEQEQDGGDLSLYMMHSPRKPALFEALICRKCRGEIVPVEETWHRETLPLPPFYDHTIDQHTLILSYAVVGNVICVSVRTVSSGSMTVRSGSTYCFDTVSQKWSLAGDWEMPFHGKAEYVPELKLWFGVSADNSQLPCAADLSPVLGGRKPKKPYVWGDPDLSDDWRPELFSSASVVSLGSGRFCIAMFLQDMEGTSWRDALSCPIGKSIVVFTGLEVLAGNGNGKESGSDSSKEHGNGNGNGLRMIKHKSRVCTILKSKAIEEVL